MQNHLPKQDKLILSVSSNKAEAYRHIELDFQNLVKFITDAKKLNEMLWWSAHHFKDNYRLGANIIEGFNLIVLDIDNGASIDTVKEYFKGSTNIIYTSRSHKIATKKNPNADDRFRVILPILETLKLNKQEYKSYMAAFIKTLPFPVDNASTDIARAWFTNNNYNFQIFVNEPKDRENNHLFINIAAYNPFSNLTFPKFTDFSETKHNRKLTEIEVKTMLTYLDPIGSDLYQYRLEIGMSLHDWDKQRGYYLWKDWCALASDAAINKPGLIESKWRTFKDDGTKTVATLVYYAKEAGYTREYISLYDLVKGRI